MFFVFNESVLRALFLRPFVGLHSSTVLFFLWRQYGYTFFFAIKEDLTLPIKKNCSVGLENNERKEFILSIETRV